VWVLVVGDLHGQFYDLVHLMNLGDDDGDKKPEEDMRKDSNMKWLFLGDYVDRYFVFSTFLVHITSRLSRQLTSK